jgi:hypothetical protein
MSSLDGKLLDLIRRLVDRLPGCLDDDEFASVIQNFAPQLTGDRAYAAKGAGRNRVVASFQSV